MEQPRFADDPLEPDRLFLSDGPLPESGRKTATLAIKKCNVKEDS
jgi:hypothetical protein